MKIKAVNNSTSDVNNYCGPAVISAVTGMTTGEAARLIRHVSGQKMVNRFSYLPRSSSPVALQHSKC